MAPFKEDYTEALPTQGVTELQVNDFDKCHHVDYMIRSFKYCITAAGLFLYLRLCLCFQLFYGNTW